MDVKYTFNTFLGLFLGIANSFHGSHIGHLKCFYNGDRTIS